MWEGRKIAAAGFLSTSVIWIFLGQEMIAPAGFTHPQSLGEFDLRLPVLHTPAHSQCRLEK
jgi:hypothetical protein